MNRNYKETLVFMNKIKRVKKLTEKNFDLLFLRTYFKLSRNVFKL